MANKPFEIGLVGAGAVSAGAYTGGVVDFLVQALDAWYGEKAAGKPSVPRHDVRLSVFSGASAGAVTAALTAGYLGSDQPPVRSPEEAAGLAGRNKLYDSWVDRIDIQDLLRDRDLGNDKRPVISLLDSTVLKEIADQGLAVVPRAQRRPYLADDFHILLTVTNLRGVPYGIPLDSGSTGGMHAMSLHADFAHFCINDSGSGGSHRDATYLAWDRLDRSPGTEQLKLAALASSAFPLGLAPRVLEHRFHQPGQDDCYSTREWPVPLTGALDPDGGCRCTSAQAIPAEWGKLEAGYAYRFLCVDGGVMNNEPLELARRMLAGPDGRNPREGDRADRAVLMIDPFPGESLFTPDYQPPADLFGILTALFGSMKNQTRFKPDELMLAAYERNYSRFMIAPKRESAVHAIACGAVGGFGGFLKHGFRQHDFFLGRRNAQKFLKDHFVLPEGNPLFAAPAWTAAMKDAHCVRNRDGSCVLRDGERLLPIIPLVGDAAETCEAMAWPSYGRSDLGALSEGIERRLGLVLDRLVGQYFANNNALIRWGARFLGRRKKGDITRYAVKMVSGELQRMGLLR